VQYSNARLQCHNVITPWNGDGGAVGRVTPVRAVGQTHWNPVFHHERRAETCPACQFVPMVCARQNVFSPPVPGGMPPGDASFIFCIAKWRPRDRSFHPGQIA
jgi:hypothetical protein